MYAAHRRFEPAFAIGDSGLAKRYGRKQRDDELAGAKLLRIPNPKSRIPAPHQCTPRINAANAICSWLGLASRSALRSPLAAAESGNSSKAVFITTS